MSSVFNGERMKDGVIKLASLIKKSKDTVILTGAGMDTESNIPDFRSEKGWWRSIDPRTVANIDTFYENYSLFHEFYDMRLRLLVGIQPHKGHYILSDLEKKGMIRSIATQNVAGLHVMAGSQNVYELHGNIRKIRCNNCNHEASLERFLAVETCGSCGDKGLRPSVILFGETLPPKAWDSALRDIQKCDLLIVIGTSLEVYPVNHLPMLTKGKKVFINNEERSTDYAFDLTIIGKAKEVLEALNHYLLL
ncbi:Silent information regulator protein Sir2 [Alkaliphilus metalliredigens QYMF]|uniref:protein acetyllysine N-acetyltransferase n=1 Tax=Alkaliphilus metalliredigens (strain QYMF) TaxID=293826 RepID=A6TNA0_ALKMQ|nr:NAD-dependent deacylase [Alkaliphilus metalliredigens]ABR47668.1 Silent information regulator protein Sir2 [Alkaliphilus metalliredigens QYMF]